MSETMIIHVKYACVDDAHFFTSGDQFSRGLCVAHQELQTAYNEVGKQLTVLLQENFGMTGDVQPVQPFAKFKDWLDKFGNLAEDTMRPIRSGVINWAKPSPEGRVLEPADA